jgi:hypothetical protein
MSNKDQASLVFLNDVKAKLCAEIIRKQDFSLMVIGEIAGLLDLDLKFEIGEHKPKDKPHD